MEKLIKQKLIERGFKEETLLNNRGLIGACIEETEQQLRLYGVVWQSEQLCEGLHSTDFNGKCFKCGEQVFIREPK